MKQSITERLSALRKLMSERGIDVWYVPTDDFHASEYVGEYFMCRTFLTGFTGSAGVCVVTASEAGLWTDGRYFLQAEKQLSGSTVTLYKSGEAGVPTVTEFLKSRLREGMTSGFDGRTVSAREADGFRKALPGVKFVLDQDLVGEIWEDRPPMSCRPAFELDVRWAGKSRKDKLVWMRSVLKEKKAKGFLLSTLDDIAWLLNIRGGDVEYNPVVLSYFYLTEEKALLFVNQKAVPEALFQALSADGVEVMPYDGIAPFLSSVKEGPVLLSRDKVSSMLVSAIPEEAGILDEDNPTMEAKAVKNDVETANMRTAHIRDGAAVTNFIFWLKQHAGEPGVTELSAADKLLEFRRLGENFRGESFAPIIAYGEHAAVIHYSATEETDVPILKKGMLLADTGGQYLEGTTDITRTIVLGDVTDEEKKYFTLVLKGHLRLLDAVFRYGCTGLNLDYLAREPLWRLGKDYNHGTGHGVGYYLNVHEAPNGFRWRQVPERRDSAPFEPGMITSDEPGYYEPGAFGIRHESLLLCREKEVSDGMRFLCFEPLTMVPFDLAGIDPELLTESEKDILNRYHRKVFETLSPILSEEVRDWLYHETREI